MNIKRKLKKYLYKIKQRILVDDSKKLMLGKQLCFLQKLLTVKSLADVEFKVFSQWGEDGIIEYLVSKIPIKNKFFIEFGVENYNESNTRFLMMNRDWRGIIIDGSKENIEYIKKRNYFWKYDLHPINSFITKENINELIGTKLKELQVNNDVGILSVDIDGVDYWVLNEINCINPQIIICEYHSIYGNELPLTVPYDPNFVRTNFHYSNLYFGANLLAFEKLLSARGYVYVGSNMQCSNAFFVKKSLYESYLGNLDTDFYKNKITNARESRCSNGNLSFLGGVDRLKKIAELELYNIDTEKNIKIKELL